VPKASTPPKTCSRLFQTASLDLLDYGAPPRRLLICDSNLPCQTLLSGRLNDETPVSYITAGSLLVEPSSSFWSSQPGLQHAVYVKASDILNASPANDKPVNLRLDSSAPLLEYTSKSSLSLSTWPVSNLDSYPAFAELGFKRPSTSASLTYVYSIWTVAFASNFGQLSVLRKTRRNWTFIVCHIRQHRPTINHLCSSIIHLGRTLLRSGRRSPLRR
jgi:hypothetical protein